MLRRPLTSSLHAWSSRVSRGAENRPLLRAGHQAAVRTEIALASAWAARRAVSAVDPGNLTLVIKTFQRPDVLARMLTSVRRVFLGPIIVADDSLSTFVSDDPNVRVLALPFDSGIGAGRNALIDAVTTEYLWMADDDMIVLPDLDIGAVVAYLERNHAVDLCGGRVINLPLWQSADYSTSPLFAYRGRPLLPRGTVVDGLPVYDKVPNYYVARTSSVRAVRYDDRLKRVDHRDFFTSAFGKMVSVFDSRFVCLHSPSYFDPDYQSFRMDTAADFAYLAQKWPASGAIGRGVSDDLADEVVTAFHHAAIEVVAGDLSLDVVHGGVGEGHGIQVHVRELDRRRLSAALLGLGWTRRGRRFTHPLWGEVALISAPDLDSLRSNAGAAAFAGVAGLATAGGAWPRPNRSGAVVMGDGTVRWSPRAGWTDHGGQLFAAPLPQGPIIELTSPGDVIWEAIGPHGIAAAELPARVREVFPDAPEEADQQISAYLDALTSQGLVVADSPE